METKDIMEGDYLNVKLVNESPSKRCLIIGAGSKVDKEFEGRKSKRVELPVEIDGKEKTWSMNRTTLENMSVLGTDTIKWLGTFVSLKVETIKGKDCVVGTPMSKPFEFRAKDGE